MPDPPHRGATPEEQTSRDSNCCRIFWPESQSSDRRSLFYHRTIRGFVSSLLNTGIESRRQKIGQNARISDRVETQMPAISRYLRQKELPVALLLPDIQSAWADRIQFH